MNCDLVICTICQEWLYSENDIVVIHCGHIFHSSCLNRWVTTSKSCPSCRFAIKSDSIVPVYFDEEQGVYNQDHQMDVGIMRAAYRRLRQEAFLKEEVYNELNARYKTLNAEVTVCRKKMDEDKKSIDELKKQITDLQCQYEASLRKNRSIDVTLFSLKNLNNTLRDKSESQCAELKKLNDVKELLNNEIAEISMDQKILEPKILTACLSSLKKDLQTSIKSEKVLKNELNQMHANMKKLERENHKLKNDNKISKEVIRSMKEKNEKPVPSRVPLNDFTANEGPSTSNQGNMPSTSRAKQATKRKPGECSMQQGAPTEPKRNRKRLLDHSIQLRSCKIITNKKKINDKETFLTDPFSTNWEFVENLCNFEPRSTRTAEEKLRMSRLIRYFKQ